MTLHVGLASWIIQDGNYGDFETGREYRFALEFYPITLAATTETSMTPSLSHRSGALHDAYGRVVFCSGSAWAVDFGVPAFREEKPPDWARVHDCVAGEVYVGVDPFFYLEYLKNEQGMPDLFRRWRIRRILLDTTPWLESIDSHGRTVVVRDAAHVSFEEVPSTDAWNHGDGRGEYVLECELLSDSAV